MSLRRLARNALSAMAQVVVSAGLLFEFYRFLIRQLGSTQVGTWSLVVAITTLARIVECGVGSGVRKFVAGDLGAGERERAAGTIGMALAAIGAMIGTACLLFQPILHAGLPLLIDDPRSLAAARELLPWALAAVWAGSIGQLFLAALDANQRTDLRAATTISGSVGQLVAAYLIVPGQGLRGLGPVHLVHSVVVMLLGGALVAGMLRIRVRSWFAVDRGRFVAVLRYGTGVQLGAVAQLLFEPTVKVLLSVVAGLSTTGYYDMANRFVAQARALVVAAYEMLVPYVAYRVGSGGGIDRARFSGEYRSAHALLFVLAIPYFSLLAAALPVVFTLWLGRFDAHFIQIGLLLLAGWTLNTLTVTAYMLYLASGSVHWTLMAHVAIGVLNVAFAALGGWWFGPFGVLAGAMLSLALGSAVVSLAFHREFNVPYREFMPAKSAALLGVSLFGAAAFVAGQFQAGSRLRASPGLILGLLGFAVACSVLVSRHPAVVNAARRLRASPTP